jgi:hypothetical protein
MQKVSKEPIRSDGPKCSARRMIKEYSEKFYAKALKYGHRRQDQWGAFLRPTTYEAPIQMN